MSNKLVGLAVSDTSRHFGTESADDRRRNFFEALLFNANHRNVRKVGFETLDDIADLVVNCRADGNFAREGLFRALQEEINAALAIQNLLLDGASEILFFGSLFESLR